MLFIRDICFRTTSASRILALNLYGLFIFEPILLRFSGPHNQLLQSQRLIAMRSVIIFFGCLAISIIGALFYLHAIMPPGEGSFGIAKAVPFLFAQFTFVLFCLIWFPANLIDVYVSSRAANRNWMREESVVLGGLLFAFALCFCGFSLGPLWFYKVHFHERLEDQFGMPVAGATIKISMRRENGYQAPRKEFTLESDNEGAFEITCRPAESFQFTPEKSGYIVASLNTSGAYSEKLRADQKLPPVTSTIIKMWKRQGTEPLATLGKEYKLPYTDKPVYFDLIAKEIVSNGGDLKITVNRPPDEISEQNPQKWQLHFEVMGGGFIETSSEESAITFAAPAGNYQPDGIFGNNNGTGVFEKSFFVKSRNGRVFSKLYLSFMINREPNDSMYIAFNGVANTNGSPNWEATAPY